MTQPEWSDRFPILKDTTYLASHTLGAVPASTRDALAQYHEQWATLGIGAWEGPWWEDVVDFGRTMAALIGAPSGSVVPLPNATRAMAGVASCLDYGGSRNRVVMTDLEFTTFYPFWGAQQRLGAELVVVESDGGMDVPADRIAAAVDDRTALVATCHAYFRSGALQDLAPIVEAAQDAGAMTMVDGYQAVGTVPVDVGRLGVDFYLGGSHKYLCGGPGAGYLYVRPDRVAELRPRLTGWFGMQNPFSFETDTTGETLHEGTLRFLDGTPNVPGIVAAREGIRAVADFGVDRIRRRSVRMTQDVIDRALDSGLEVRTPVEPARRSGMVCLQFEGSEEAASALVERGIVVDWRPDCGLRMAPHFYNDDADIDAFFEALASVAAKAT